jgi:hypothetical protein
VGIFLNYASMRAKDFFALKSPLGRRSTNHRFGPDCDHDSFMRTSSRRAGESGKRSAFSKARQGRLLHRPSECESAQSAPAV